MTIYIYILWKPKGADRKLKTDKEKIEKKALQDKEKYQLSHETTLLKEVRQCVLFYDLRSLCLLSFCEYCCNLLIPQ